MPLASERCPTTCTIHPNLFDDSNVDHSAHVSLGTQKTVFCCSIVSATLASSSGVLPIKDSMFWMSGGSAHLTLHVYKSFLIYLRPLLPILTFTPHFADLSQFSFHRSAILKEHRIFVCLCIICSNGASVELLGFFHVNNSPTEVPVSPGRMTCAR